MQPRNSSRSSRTRYVPYLAICLTLTIFGPRAGASVIDSDCGGLGGLTAGKCISDGTLHWVDWTPFRGQSYNDVTARFATDLAGFRYATEAEVLGLLTSNGFTGGFTHNDSIPNPLADALLTALACTPLVSVCNSSIGTVRFLFAGPSCVEGVCTALIDQIDITSVNVPVGPHVIGVNVFGTRATTYRTNGVGNMIVTPVVVAPPPEIHTAFVPDYFPIDRKAFCRRTCEDSGTEQTTVEIVGSTTAPYSSQPLTGSIFCADNGDEPSVWHNDGVTFKILLDDNFYTSTDCALSQFPLVQAFGLVHDGEFLNDAGVMEVRKDFSDCGAVDPHERLLFQIQDLTIRGKPFKNALLLWGLKDNLPFVPLDFQGKDLEWGLTLPGAAETGGRAVDDISILGVGESLIGGADIDDVTGVLEGFIELVSVDCSSGATWDVFDVSGTGNAIANGINDDGDVVGHSASPLAAPASARALLRRDGVVETIHPAGAIRSRAFSINNLGAIVGDFRDVGGEHGFLLQDSVYTPIDFPAAAASTLPFGTNDQGDIVGRVDYTDGTPRHGFLLQNSEFTVIEVPGAVRTQARDINNFGDIVGHFEDGMDPKSETSREGTMNQGTVRRFDCLEDDSRRSSSWRPSGGSKPASPARLSRASWR